VPSKKKLTTHGAPPIVVVSNRLPFTYSRTAKGFERRPSPGGLVAALEPVLRKHGGKWIGWPGIEVRQDEELPTRDEPYGVVPILLSDGEVSRYYHGMSNRTLWPLLHSMPARAQFERRDWDSYEKVNARFAEIVVAEAADDSVIWVHDYHMMLAPAAIREKRPDNRIAFFLHIPFPSYDTFRLLPWDREILRALLACDLLGFQVPGYARNFLDCVELSLGARVHRGDDMVVEYGDRTTRVGVFPIGIEFEAFETMAREAPPQPEVSHRVVLGVDRLDYTKGIPERIYAFERLLEIHPEYREKIVLLQIAVPSRSQVAEYRELKSELDELVGRVNGHFATANWSPIRYLYRSFTRDRLAGIYRDADVALITPLRDGMNLVAKEFVACQVEDPGVLILSKLAGAANTMQEALRVNPYDIDGTAEAIHRALSMEDSERASRGAALRRRERRDNIDEWVSSFLEAATGRIAALAPISDADFEKWLGVFLRGHTLALFLDYDGTLCPLQEHPSEAVLSTAMRRTLKTCSRRPDTDVAIISGRSLEDLRQTVNDPELTYAGNHGLEIDGADVPHFVHEDLLHYRARVEALAKELGRLSVDGAWVEEKGPTLTYHYRAVAGERAEALAKEAHSIINTAGYQARDAHRAVEARPPIGWDKGRAVLHVLRSRYGPSWSENVRVIYVGDDETDEDAFRLLSGLAITFRLGSPNRPTAASRRLSDVNAVRTLLHWLSKRS